MIPAAPSGAALSPLSHRQIFVERVTGSGPPVAEALLGVAQALERALDTGPLVYAGRPARRIAPAVADVAKWVDEVTFRRAQGEFALYTLASDPTLPSGRTLTFEVEPLPEMPIEFVWCTLPEPVRQERSPDGLLELLAAVRTAFGGHRAVVEDDRLLLRYRGVRASERAREATPPELRHYVPEPLPVPGLAGDLPDLLVPQEFDRRRVPDAVWWLNVWDAVQVETVGRDVIARAPWSVATELPDGAMALAATTEPTDPGRPEHLARLTEIVARLGLRDLQERHRHAG